MIQRPDYESELRRLLSFYPAVGLIGSRQVGKTTMAKAVAAALERPVKYLDLERADDLARLADDPAFYLEQFQEYCVILDEIQRLPELFGELRSLIDRHRVPGRFLLLGSASPLLQRTASESLAGRIGYLTLHPIDATEADRAKVDPRTHWWRGGYPEALLAPDDSLSMHWRNSFIQTYVERDVPMLGLNANPRLFGTFLRMLASVHGSLWNAHGIGNSLGISAPTVRTYLHFLEESFVAHSLAPFHVNIPKRLVKSSKVYLKDSGLLHALLGIRSPGDDLISHPHVGASWEGYVISQILSRLPEGLEGFFYRTSDGTECDLVLVRGVRPVACVEVKYGSRATIQAGLKNVIQTLQTAQNYVIAHTAERYRVAEQIEAIPLLVFLKEVLPSL